MANKVSACNRVMVHNSNLPHMVFSFLELGKENGRAAAVCKKWKAHAEEQYKRTLSLDLNIFSVYKTDDRCAVVMTRVLGKCLNLKKLTVFAAPYEVQSEVGKFASLLHGRNMGAMIATTHNVKRYFPIFQSLPKTLEELDASTVSYEFHHIACPVNDPAHQIPVTPSIRKLTLDKGLNDYEIDQIAKKMPGLQVLKTEGLIDLEYLLKKVGSLRAIDLTFTGKEGLIRHSTDTTLAAVPERPLLQSVTLSDAAINDQLLKFLIVKAPNLASLTLCDCRGKGETQFLDSLPKAEKPENKDDEEVQAATKEVITLNAEQLKDLRAKLDTKS